MHPYIYRVDINNFRNFKNVSVILNNKPSYKNIAPEMVTESDGTLFDISKINFDLLKQEFKKYSSKNTIIQELNAAIQDKLKR